MLCALNNAFCFSIFVNIFILLFYRRLSIFDSLTSILIPIKSFLSRCWNFRKRDRYAKIFSKKHRDIPLPLRLFQKDKPRRLRVLFCSPPGQKESSWLLRKIPPYILSCLSYNRPPQQSIRNARRQ